MQQISETLLTAREEVVVAAPDSVCPAAAKTAQYLNNCYWDSATGCRIVLEKRNAIAEPSVDWSDLEFAQSIVVNSPSQDRCSPECWNSERLRGTWTGAAGVPTLLLRATTVGEETQTALPYRRATWIGSG